MKTTHFPNGLTVADLKRVIAKWPETNTFGEPTIVRFRPKGDMVFPIFETCPLKVSWDKKRRLSRDFILVGR